MPANPIDSLLFKDQFGTEEMREIFADETLLQHWLDAEAALAQAEAELSLIPPEAAEEITKKANVSNMDFDVIRKGMKDTSHPLITVIRELEKACDGDAGGYVHWGATTQDIIDTGLALQVKSAHQLLLKQTQQLLTTCLDLSESHKGTLMPGRTHGQHALPITFGYKVSIWADELGRHIERMNQGAERYLYGQFGGAAGTLASLGKDGLAVQERYNRILGLHQPTVTWHAARDHYAEFSMVVAMISATTAKIANEIINLQRTEIGELEEGFEMGKVGSSTMPHKRNPMICEYIVSLSHVVRKKASLGLDCMIQEHERDMAFWQTEWSYLPEVCILTSGGIDQLQGVLKNLIVHEERMKENLHVTKGLIVSENVMLGLGKYVGRQKAHDIIYDASMKAYEEDRPLEELLLENDYLLTFMDKSTIQAYTDPTTYSGLSEQFVERVLEKWRPIYS
ncbi:adenylosuccinate lyase [Shouchella lehensis]|uniref:Adenylosuccinate lyase n=1 Tax=Shouchella lehensis G1 TaxID=1246626 RepID=A0A060LW21_9BACI|nr:adenylosuccinate lyase [Shouchella lehensis]AIC94392.1 adenylosuccinate lyase [Shouchella lehensis G1]